MHPRLMWHLLILLFTLWAGSAAQAEPTQPFAALQVTPYGAQQYDLATGITTLPDGGQIIDQEVGAVLTGSFVRYLEADFIEIRDAAITLGSGSVTADEARLDLATLVLEARGQVIFQYADMTLAAERLTAHLTPEVVVVTGDVVSEDPLLRTDALLLRLPARQALLVGPYTYRSGPLTLNAQTPDDFLTLRWEEEGDETVVDATTELDPELMTHLEPYLP